MGFSASGYWKGMRSLPKMCSSLRVDVNQTPWFTFYTLWFQQRSAVPVPGMDKAVQSVGACTPCSMKRCLLPTAPHSTNLSPFQALLFNGDWRASLSSGLPQKLVRELFLLLLCGSKPVWERPVMSKRSRRLWQWSFLRLKLLQDEKPPDSKKLCLDRAFRLLNY